MFLPCAAYWQTSVSTKQAAYLFYNFTDIKAKFTMYGIGSAGNFNFIIWQWYRQAGNCFIVTYCMVLAYIYWFYAGI